MVGYNCLSMLQLREIRQNMGYNEPIRSGQLTTKDIRCNKKHATVSVFYGFLQTTMATWTKLNTSHYTTSFHTGGGVFNDMSCFMLIKKIVCSLPVVVQLSWDFGDYWKELASQNPNLWNRHLVKVTLWNSWQLGWRKLNCLGGELFMGEAVYGEKSSSKQSGLSLE